MGFFIWLFCIRYCAYQGSKRVIGWRTGLLCGIFGVFGILMVRSSRRLITEDEIKAIRLAAMEGGE